DQAAEAAALEKLRQFGFRFISNYSNRSKMEISANHLPRAVRGLVEAGWFVEAEGKIYRQSGAIRFEVRSGIDWFELHGNVKFGDASAKLPALLEALKRGENMVRLDDGTFGLVPEEWLKRYGLLAGLGTADGDHLRFKRSQTSLLDTLLASQPDVRHDKKFLQA